MAQATNDQRSFLHALYLHVLIRAKHLFLTWFYLKPLLCKHISRTYQRTELGAQENLKIGFATYLSIKLLWMIAAFFQQNRVLPALYVVTGLYHLVHLFFKPLERTVLRKYRRNGASRQVLPIPEFDWKSKRPEQFVEEYIKHPFPVVLRSFFQDREALKKWSFEALLEQFGDETVLLTTHQKDGFKAKLSQVRDPSIYCHNSEFLFQKYPHLKERLDFSRLEPLSGGMKMAYCQLFIGRKGTGTPFHCAAVWNWFFMLDGRKRWYLVDPVNTLLLYPFLSMGQVAAMSHCSYPDRYNKEAYPLFEYCPMYTVVLEKGDLLLNPAWWWHAIENLSEESVAVASRWHQDGVVGKNLIWTEESYEINRFFSVLLQLGLASPLIMQRLLRHPSPKFDEHTTLREKRNRFVDLHYKLVTGKIGGIYHKL